MRVSGKLSFMKSSTIFWLVVGAALAGLVGALAWAPDQAQNGPAAIVPAVAPAPPQRRFSDVLRDAPGAGQGLFAPRRANAIYGRNGRIVDLGGGNVAQYLALRMGAARSGDVKAAYEAYQAISVCATIDDPVAEYADPAERAAFLSERQGVVKLCEGISAAQVQERLGFLASAARAGHTGAQVDFYMEGPYGRDIDIAANPDDPVVRQWKAEALGYLERAGNTCDHFSLALLSTAYDAGQLAGRDMVKSMAYSIAADVPRNRAQTEEQLRDRFGAELSAEQFAAARQLGTQLARQSCPGK